ILILFTLVTGQRTVLTAASDFPGADHRAAAACQPATIPAEPAIRAGEARQLATRPGLPQAAGSVPPRTEQEVAALRELHAECRGTVPWHDDVLPAGGGIPEVNLQIGAGHRQEEAVWVPRHGRGASRMGLFPEESTRGQVAHLHFGAPVAGHGQL